MKKYMFCNNCGKQGHLYQHCKSPITSIGIIAFKKIENQIMKGYEMLDSPEDKDLFYDYLITNLKLYFDKFEDELQASITPEPTTPEYEKEKAAQDDDAAAGLTEESDDDIFDLGN